MGILLALLASIAFGLSNIFVKKGLQYISPAISTLISLLTSFTLVAIVTTVFDLNSLVSISFTALIWFALLGVLYFSLARNLLFWGIQVVGTSKASAISASYPLFTVILAVTILEESLTIKIITGTLLVVGGLFLILNKNGKTSVTVKTRALGYIFSLASALCYGCGMVINKWGVSKLTTPLVGSTISLAFGCLMLSLVLLIRGFNITLSENKKGIRFILIAGFLSGFGQISLFFAMSMASATIVSVLSGTYPLFTLLAVHFFFQRLEKNTPFLMIGCLLVVIGGIFIMLSTL